MKEYYYTRLRWEQTIRYTRCGIRFSFRHRELENKIEVFEVDHPSTQLKKERIKEAELEIPNNLHFVSMDFTKGFSYEQLRNEGFENKRLSLAF